MSIIVPPDQLAPSTLQALIEEFITRHGAVQGHTDVPLNVMVQAVRRQLKSGEAVIVFDEEEESCTITPREQRTKMSDPPECDPEA
jgi:uncharacterized protein